MQSDGVQPENVGCACRRLHSAVVAWPSRMRSRCPGHCLRSRGTRRACAGHYTLLTIEPFAHVASTRVRCFLEAAIAASGADAASGTDVASRHISTGCGVYAASRRQLAPSAPPLAPPRLPLPPFPPLGSAGGESSADDWVDGAASGGVSSTALGMPSGLAFALIALGSVLGLALLALALGRCLRDAQARANAAKRVRFFIWRRTAIELESLSPPRGPRGGRWRSAPLHTRK